MGGCWGRGARCGVQALGRDLTASHCMSVRGQLRAEGDRRDRSRQGRMGQAGGHLPWAFMQVTGPYMHCLLGVPTLFLHGWGP